MRRSGVLTALAAVVVVAGLPERAAAFGTAPLCPSATRKPGSSPRFVFLALLTCPASLESASNFSRSRYSRASVHCVFHTPREPRAVCDERKGPGLQAGQDSFSCNLLGHPREQVHSCERHVSRGSLTLRGGVAPVAAASMSAAPPGPLVSCEWLKENLANVKVLDASWYVPTMERSPGVKFDGIASFSDPLHGVYARNRFKNARRDLRRSFVNWLF